MSRPQPRGGRRAPLPPSPLHDELVRSRVLDVLATRFDVPLISVVAGAGFGKTTALAQAIRANDAAPRGLDAWVACEPGDEDAGRLSSAIVSATGVSVRGGDHLDRVLRAVGSIAPVDVCLVIDDLHELPPSSAGERLVQDLTARLPPHAHVVLASRIAVPIPLERRRAAGQLAVVGEELLAFTDAEVASLAAAVGDDAVACEGLAGWPSLVRLVLSAPVGSLRQFLWEEIVTGLSAAEQSGLLALAVLGSGTAEDAARVAGRVVDVERLVGVVPLLYRDATGTLGAHRLWEDAAERIFPAGEVRDARRRALELFRERGDTVRMGSAAAAWREPGMLRAACVALVRENLGVLPIDTAERWLADLPSVAAASPESHLLGLALRHAQDRDIENLDTDLDALEATFVERSDFEGQIVTLGLGAVSAHARNDLLRLLTLSGRITALPGATDHPELRFFVDAVEAAATSLAGDVGRTLEIIDEISFDEVPVLVREIVVRLHATMLCLAGRAGEAIPVAASLIESPHAYVRSIPSMVRWLAGDPSDYLSKRPDMGSLLDVNPYRFVSAAHCAGVAASLGDHELAEFVRPDIEDASGRAQGARDLAIASVAQACLSVLAHDESAARVTLADYFTRVEPGDPRADPRLRRHLAVPYVLDERVRQFWDGVELGPLHGRARDLARQFLAARDGVLARDAVIDPPAFVLTTLPLAWSLELAVRADAAGVEDARSLLRTLLAWLPSAARSEVAWLAECGDAVCRTTATQAIDDLCERSQEPVHIAVLGELQVRSGEAELDSPELRRGRVRTMLAVLVLRGSVRRAWLTDLLWPDLEPSAAAQNLRVTLTRLRRVFASGRAGDQVSGVLRSGDVIELMQPPLVDSDLAQFRRHLADSDRARQLGDSADEVASLTRAVDLWRGEPLVDLASVDDLAGDVEYVRGSLLDACLRLGELLLVAGRFDDSLRHAERVRVASPYSERAHRLAIACQLQRNDRAGLDFAVRSTEGLLRELDVEPDDATMMLLRRAATRLGAGS